MEIISTWAKESSRTFLLLLYPDCEDHVLAFNRVIESNLDYAYILHDRDCDDSGELKKPHFHIVLRFKNERENYSIARELGVPVNYLVKAKNYRISCRYLIHADNADKFQYSLADVSGPLVPEVRKYLSAELEINGISDMLDWISNYPGTLTVEATMREACRQGLYSVFRRSGNLFRCVIEEHNQMQIVCKKDGI